MMHIYIYIYIYLPAGGERHGGGGHVRRLRGGHPADYYY